MLVPWPAVERSLSTLVEVLSRKQDFLESYVGGATAVLTFEWSYADLAEVTLRA